MYKKKIDNYGQFLDINIEYYKTMFKEIIIEDYWDEYGHKLGD